MVWLWANITTGHVAKTGNLGPIENSEPFLIGKAEPLEAGNEILWNRGAHARYSARNDVRGVRSGSECGVAASPRSVLGHGRGR